MNVEAIIAQARELAMHNATVTAATLIEKAFHGEDITMLYMPEALAAPIKAIQKLVSLYTTAQHDNAIMRRQIDATTELIDKEVSAIENGSRYFVDDPDQINKDDREHDKDDIDALKEIRALLTNEPGPSMTVLELHSREYDLKVIRELAEELLGRVMPDTNLNLYDTPGLVRLIVER